MADDEAYTSGDGSDKATDTTDTLEQLAKLGTQERKTLLSYGTGLYILSMLAFDGELSPKLANLVKEGDFKSPVKRHAGFEAEAKLILDYVRKYRKPPGQWDASDTKAKHTGVLTALLSQGLKNGKRPPVTATLSA